MSEDPKSFNLVGRFVIAKSTHGSGYWGKLNIPTALIQGLYAAINEPGIELSPGNAHVTVLTSDEVEKIGKQNITENGKYFAFKLQGVKHVRPSGWHEMSRVWFVEVSSPELKKLRASYGLTYLPHGHNFHVTIAVRRKGILAPNDTVTKHAFVTRDMLMPLAAGLTGAGIGHMTADKGRKGNWMQRHIGALMGMGIGSTAGFGLNKLLNSANATADTNIKPQNAVPDTGEQPLTARVLPAHGAVSSVINDAAIGAMYAAHPAAIASEAGIGALWNKLHKLVSKTPAKVPSALSGAISGGVTFPAGWAGGGVGAYSANKVMNDLNVDSAAARIGHSANAAGVGYTAGTNIGNRILRHAAPVAAKWFPRAAELMSKAPVAKALLGKGNGLLMASTALADSGETFINRLRDPANAKARAEQTNNLNTQDIARYGNVGGGLKILGRSFLSPGAGINLVDEMAANKWLR